MAENKKGEKKAKTKLPSAQKRILQSERANLQNRSYRAKVASATRSLKESVEKKEGATVQTKLNTLFSLMDKGVKTGVYKANKASRVKSRFSTLARSVSA